MAASDKGTRIIPEALEGQPGIWLAGFVMAIRSTLDATARPPIPNEAPAAMTLSVLEEQLVQLRSILTPGLAPGKTTRDPLSDMFASMPHQRDRLAKAIDGYFDDRRTVPGLVSAGIEVRDELSRRRQGRQSEIETSGSDRANPGVVLAVGGGTAEARRESARKLRLQLDDMSSEDIKAALQLTLGLFTASKDRPRGQQSPADAAERGEWAAGYDVAVAVLGQRGIALPPGLDRIDPSAGRTPARGRDDGLER